MVQVLSEKQINVEQLSLQHDEAVAQNWQLEQIMVEACCRAPELKIAVDLRVDTRIHKFSNGFHEAKYATRIQLALNL